MKNYILKGRTPVEEPDIITWAKWFEKADRNVKRTTLPDGVLVSTIFLGLDHNFLNGAPILFETMIFGGEHDQWCDRYETWEQAEAGHQNAIEMIFA
jgi:hypothetical protein